MMLAGVEALCNQLCHQHVMGNVVHLEITNFVFVTVFSDTCIVVPFWSQWALLSNLCLHLKLTHKA